MRQAYCLSTDKNEEVLKLLKSEIKYKEICPKSILKAVEKKIAGLKDECERRGVDVPISI